MEELQFLYQIFPQGLKVLLVGIDNVTQDLIKTYLPPPFYQITALPHDTYPISFLGDRSNSFDLVISDVVLKHIDGYQFIKDQRLKTNIPHFLICDLERSSYDEMLKAFRCGACYVLGKPVSAGELNNLWQHICWSREQRRREIIDTEQQPNTGQQPDTGQQHETEQQSNSDVEDPDQIGQNLNPDKDPKVENISKFMNYVGASWSNKQRQRIVWSEELHTLFVEVVEKLDGAENAVPKAIAEAMNVYGLTRENVASHLQKYRIYLKKKQMKKLQECQHINVIMPVDRIPPSTPGETSYRRFDNTNDNEVSVLEPCTTHHHFSDAQFHHFQHVLAGRQMLMQMQKQPEQNFNYGDVLPLSMVPSSSLPRQQQNLVSAMLQLNQNLASVSCYVPTIRGCNGGIITPEASDLHGDFEMISNSYLNESNSDFIGSEYFIPPYLDMVGFRRFEEMNQDEW